MQYIEIIAGEKIVYEIDYTLALPAGASSIASGTVSAKKVTSSGVVSTAYDDLFLSTTATIVAGKLRYTIDSALASERYRVEITAITNDSQIVKTRLFYSVATA